MRSDYPTKRPTDADHLDPDAVDPPADLLNLPWVDVHNHAHTLSWADRERYALSGCRSMVMVAGGYHWLPYRPVEADDVRFLWDDALGRRERIRREHFFETDLAIGIHTGVRVADPDALLEAMGEYCALDEVAAVGETGITPSQHVSAWGLEGQRAVVGAQMELAREHDLPVLLHTPNRSGDSDRRYRPGVGVPGYEKNTSLAQEPVLEAENAALESVRIDLELAEAAGLPEDRIVASHADSNNASYLLENTDCYLSFTLGHSWLTGVTVADVAEVIEEYGPGRIMIDTDCANVLRTDVRSLKRAILELYRLGVDEDAIRTVVLENPRTVFDVAA